MEWVNCSRCGRLTAVEACWQEVSGWVQKRSGGGANAIHRRKVTGRFLCVPCMHVVDSGGGEQKSLFGEGAA